MCDVGHSESATGAITFTHTVPVIDGGIAPTVRTTDDTGTITNIRVIYGVPSLDEFTDRFIRLRVLRN